MRASQAVYRINKLRVINMNRGFESLPLRQFLRNPPNTSLNMNSHQTLLFRFATLKNPANGSISEQEPYGEAVPQRQTPVWLVGHQACPGQPTQEPQRPAPRPRGTTTSLTTKANVARCRPWAVSPMQPSKGSSRSAKNWTPVLRAWNFPRSPNRSRSRNRTSPPG